MESVNPRRFKWPMPAPATLDLGGFDQTVGCRLRPVRPRTSPSCRTRQAIPANNTLTLNTRGKATFNGSINGNINLTIAGTGTQILSGSNSYAGNTRINGGRLQLGADGAHEWLVEPHLGWRHFRN